MRKITEIIVHCTATRADWAKQKSTRWRVDEVRRWHVDEIGWLDIGYHFLVDRDGTVANGRPVEITGAHCKGHNQNTIGIALFGGHGSTAHDKFLNHFTPQQDDALRKLIADLRREFPSINKVTGHNRYSAKACPGFIVNEWMSEVDPQPISWLTWLVNILTRKKDV